MSDINWSNQEKIWKSELCRDPRIDYSFNIKSTYLSPEAKKDIIQFKFNRNGQKKYLLCLNEHTINGVNRYKILCHRCIESLSSHCLTCKFYNIYWNK